MPDSQYGNDFIGARNSGMCPGDAQAYATNLSNQRAQHAANLQSIASQYQTSSSMSSGGVSGGYGGGGSGSPLSLGQSIASSLKVLVGLLMIPVLFIALFFIFGGGLTIAGRALDSFAANAHHRLVISLEGGPPPAWYWLTDRPKFDRIMAQRKVLNEQWAQQRAHAAAVAKKKRSGR